MPKSVTDFILGPCLWFALQSLSKLDLKFRSHRMRCRVHGPVSIADTTHCHCIPEYAERGL